MAAIGLALYTMNGRRILPGEESSLKWSMMIAVANICLSLLVWYRLGSELFDFVRSFIWQLGQFGVPADPGARTFKI